MKKILSVFLSLALVVAFIPSGLFAVKAKAAEREGYYYYTVTGGEATITDCDTSISGDVTIPSTLGGYPVTQIGEWAFAFCSNITSVSIANGVTSIGSGAFQDCLSLTNVVISNSVETIEDQAFQGCTSLTSIVIPDGVVCVDACAFQSCNSLVKVSISNTVTSIGDYAFAGCSALAEITVESGNENYHSNGNCLIETKENKILRGCKTSIIPEYVTSIGEYAFNSCLDLTNISIPDNVSNIDWSAFADCTDLVHISIPNSVAEIGGFTFEGCTALTSITIPNSVTEIGVHAFEGCDNLENVYYRGTLEEKNEIDITDNYGGNDSLLSAIWHYNSCVGKAEHSYENPCDTTCNDCGEEREAPHTYDNDCDTTCNECGAVRNIEHSYENPCDITCNSCGEVRNIVGTTFVLDGVEYQIKNNSALSVIRYSDESIQEITIPSKVYGVNVTSIGNRAFYGCNSLKSITIPDTVKSIGSYAFRNCTSVTSVTIGSAVTSIGIYAFENCSSLTSITIPDSVTSMGDYAFRGCTSLTSVTIGSGVTSIDNGAFSKCDNLKMIHITDIAKWCGISFDDHSSNPLCNGAQLYLNNELVTDLVIPDGVESISKYAFRGCTSLTSVTIPDSVTSIGDYAFRGCTSLTSITIPDSVTSIGLFALDRCSSLTSVTIPDSVTSIGDYAFRGCTSLTSITIPDSVTSIGLFALDRCSSLTSVTIPDSVTSIGDYAFRGCTSLTSVTIGSAVTSIGDCAFESCSSLTSVYYRGSVEDETKISIGSYNSALTKATWYYNSCIAKAEHSYDNENDAKCNECGAYRVAPLAKLVKAEPYAITISWDAYPGATKYWVSITNADGYKYTPSTTNTQLTISNLVPDTEYSIKINARHNGLKYTGYGDEVKISTLADETLKLSPTLCENGLDIELSISAPEDATKFWIYRVNDDGTKTLVASTVERSCRVNAVVGTNTFCAVAKIAGNYIEIDSVSIKVNEPVELSVKSGVGGAILSVSSAMNIEKIWIYKLNADGSKKLIAATSNKEYTVDAAIGENSFAVTARVLVNGSYKYYESNIATVNIDTPVIQAECKKIGSEIEIYVQSELEITKYWIYSVDADGKAKLIESTTLGTAILPSTSGTAFKVTVRATVNGRNKYITSETIMLI